MEKQFQRAGLSISEECDDQFLVCTQTKRSGEVILYELALERSRIMFELKQVEESCRCIDRNCIENVEPNIADEGCFKTSSKVYADRQELEILSIMELKYRTGGKCCSANGVDLLMEQEVIENSTSNKAKRTDVKVDIGSAQDD